MVRLRRRISWAGSALFLNSVLAPFAQAENTTAIPGDLHYLVGKQVVVGRMPLCEVNTYTANLNYSGKIATVVAFKENTANPPLSAAALSRVPETMRSMLEDMRNGGMLVLQFSDGTKLDTCGIQGVKALASKMDLPPGETIDVPLPPQVQSEQAAPVDVAAKIPPNDVCPVVVTKVVSGVSFGHLLMEALFESRLEQDLDRATHNGESKHYLDIGVKNSSDMDIAGIEVIARYTNNMGDEASAVTYVSPNSDPIKAGSSFIYSAIDRAQSSRVGAGDVTISVSRVRFTDETFWKDNGSRSCSNRSKID